MTEYGKYPLVFIKQEKDGVLIPGGLAEVSAFETFSATTLIVSSISAIEYLGLNITASLEITGAVVSVTSTGSGTPLVNISDPANPKIPSISVDTEGFLQPGLVGGGDPTVSINWGGQPLGFDHGGTNSIVSPTKEFQVPYFYDKGSGNYGMQFGDFTFNGTNLSIPSGGKYTINSNPLEANDLDDIDITFPSNNQVLSWDTGVSKWVNRTITEGGSVSLPGDLGAVLYENPVGQIAGNASIKIENNTLLASEFSANVVCATLIKEDGVTLQFKYLTQADAATTYTPLTLTTTFETTANAAATYLTQANAAVLYQPCDVLLDQLSLLDPTEHIENLLIINSEQQAATTPYGAGALNLIEHLPSPTSNNTFLKYTGTDTYIWTGVDGGSVTLPGNDGAVLYEYPTGLIAGNASIKIENNTLLASEFSANVVCATLIQEGGVTLQSKYLTQANADITYTPLTLTTTFETTANAAATYQTKSAFDSFSGTLGDLAYQNQVVLNTDDTTGTLPVIKGGTGLTSLNANSLLYSSDSTTIGEILPGGDNTYLKWDGTNYSWSFIPTGTGTALPSEPCAVVYMDSVGEQLQATGSIRVNTGILEIFSDADVEEGGLDLSPGNASEGKVRWDPVYHTLAIQGSLDSRVNLGVDEIIPVVNNTGSEIKKGQVAWVSGSSGGNLKGAISLLSTNTPDPFVLGVCLNTIADGEEGYLIKKGLIKNASIDDCIKSDDTGTVTLNDILYVSDEAGKLTTQAPTTGIHAATVAIVLSKSASNLSFGVNIEKGYDLLDLHDVAADSIDANQTLIWNSGGYFVTGSINDITGTVAISKGGTNATSYDNNSILYYNGTSFATQSGLKVIGTTLEAQSVCATQVCADGFIEGSTPLSNKYFLQAATGVFETTANAAATYTPLTLTSTFETTANAAATYTPLTLTSTFETTANAAATYTPLTLTSTFETTANAAATYTPLTLTSTFETTANAAATYTPLTLTSTFETTANAAATYLSKVDAASIYTASGTDVIFGNLITTGYIFSQGNIGTAGELGVVQNVIVTGTISEGGVLLSDKYFDKASTGIFETTANAATIYLSKSDAVSIYETTGYARVNYATTGYVQTELSEYTPLTLTSTFETTANAAATYQTKSAFNTFTGTLGDLAFVNNVSLTSTQVEGTLPINKGGTGQTSYNNGQILFYDGTQLIGDLDLIFTGGVFKPNILSSTTVCAVNIQENGVNLASKYALTGNYLTGISDNYITSNMLQNNSVIGSKIATTAIDLSKISITDDSVNEGNDYVFIARYGSPTQLVKINGKESQYLGYKSGSSELTWVDVAGFSIAPPAEFTSPSTTYFSSIVVNELSSSYQLGVSSYIENLTVTSHNIALSSLIDVSIGAATSGQVLKYNGSLWAPSVDKTTSPAGEQEGAIQFNNGGLFGADDSLYYATGTSTLISPTLSATTYLNLPSGTALWNANKILGKSLNDTGYLGSNPLVTYDALLYNINGASEWTNVSPSFVKVIYDTLNIRFKADKLYETAISTTTPTTDQALVYNGTSWAPGYKITYGTADPSGGTDGDFYIKYAPSGSSPGEIGIACSDETTDIVSGVAKATFRMPYALYLTEVRANVNTAPSGSTIIVDINKNGSTVLSTKLTIDSAEKTSKTAATAAVISDNSLADDDEITIDIDQVGSTTAGKGLKVWLIGNRL